MYVKCFCFVLGVAMKNLFNLFLSPFSVFNVVNGFWTEFWQTCKCPFFVLLYFTPNYCVDALYYICHMTWPSNVIKFSYFSVHSFLCAFNSKTRSSHFFPLLCCYKLFREESRPWWVLASNWNLLFVLVMGPTLSRLEHGLISYKIYT